MQQCSPLAILFIVPNHLAVEQTGNRIRRQVLVPIEITSVDGLVRLAKTEGQVGRSVFCAEHQGNAVIEVGLSCALDTAH